MPRNSGLRVLHIVPSKPYGGIQKLIPQLAAAQLKRGLDIRVLSLYDNERFSSDLRARGIPFLTTKNDRPSLGGCIRFMKPLAITQPSIIHLHADLLWSDMLGLALKRKTCPWVCHVHIYPPQADHPKIRLLSFVRRCLCDVYIAVSESVAEAMREYLAQSGNNNKVYTVYNGIELPELVVRDAVDREMVLYGMATRLVEGKGVWEFVKVVEQIANVQPEARFVLAGDGPIKNKVRDFIKAKGLSHLVSLPGHLDDMDSFWRSLDVAIFTSPKDACPLGLMEPQGYGVPVAAYRTGYGADELIVDGVTGLQCDWGNTSELARQSIRLATDFELKSLLTRNALAHARTEFSIDAMCSGIEETYRAVLASTIGGG